jgi:hypothetical protein
MSSNEFTHIVDGQRQWSQKGLRTIQSTLCLENTFLRFNTLKVLLTESFEECGGKFKKIQESDMICRWMLQTPCWDCSVVLHHQPTYRDSIVLRVGGGVEPMRPEKDLFPLWGIIRDKWENENRD